MNKWILLLATCFLIVGLFSSFPYTIKNPSMSNMLITGLLVLFSFIGLYMFYLGIKRKPSNDQYIEN